MSDDAWVVAYNQNLIKERDKAVSALIEIANVRTDVLDTDDPDLDWRLVARKMESLARRGLGWGS